jgi:hypothetical protein
MKDNTGFVIDGSVKILLAAVGVAALVAAAFLAYNQRSDAGLEWAGLGLILLAVLGDRIQKVQVGTSGVDIETAQKAMVADLLDRGTPTPEAAKTAAAALRATTPKEFSDHYRKLSTLVQ